MKKIQLLSSVFLLISLSNCNKENEIIKNQLETTIYYASDLHLYSSNLVSDSNTIYTKDTFTLDGRVQELDYELLNALVKKVNTDNPNYLIITGDLSFNGEKDSLLEVKRILDNVNDTKVLVIPGNHDLYSLNAFSATNDEIKYFANGVTSDEFIEIFKDYGYSDAYSYDSESLSYVYELSNNKWVVMLDFSLSRFNDYYGSALVGGQIGPSTLSWLENILKEAQEKNIEVITSSHHNLITHNKLYEPLFTIYNNQDLLDLFSKYNVRLNFSGHLHIQDIKSAVINDKEIYDIALGGLLDYGNRVGRLEIYDNCYNFTSEKLTLLDSSIDLEEYSFNVFYNKYYDRIINANNKKFKNKGEKVSEFLAKANAYYFDGAYTKINELIDKNYFLYLNIKLKTKDYKNTYYGSILKVENKDQHTLLIEKN